MEITDFRSAMVLELAEEFLDRYRKGERPPLREYIQRHPELADEIREVFPAMAMMERIAVADESMPGKGPAAAPRPPVNQGLQQLGDYRVIREIGHGGMGVVYEAEQISLGRHVALKVLPHKALASAKTKKRFEREAKAAAKLHHTNIVPVFGVGEHDGMPYYAMQFIQGMGLDVVIEELARMQRQRNAMGQGTPPTAAAPSPLPRSQDPARDIARSLLTGVFRPASEEHSASKLPSPKLADVTVDAAPGQDRSSAAVVPPIAASVTTTAGVHQESSSASSLILGSGDGSAIRKGKKSNFWHSVAQLGLQIAEALEYAHGQGILHRDIKPSNLLLDARGTVWVTDFGLAKAASAPGEAGENLTHTGDILGTLRYMPPEAFDGKSDVRGDVYSLGVTLYELLAAQPAFADADRNILIKQVTNGAPMRLDRLCPEAPRDLVTVIHKAIDREPARRYQKAEEFAEDLRRFLEDRPVRARRASGIERLARWGRRNPQVAASLAGVTTIFVIAFALVSWSYWRAEDARQDEEIQRQEAQAREKSERWERYRANMIATGSAMQLHNVGAAQSALDAAPHEHRNWEWKYFRHQLDTAQQVLRFGEPLQKVDISPDGALAVIQTVAGGPARVWNLRTHREIGQLPNHLPVTACWFDRDNSLFACEGSDRIVRWSSATGQQHVVLESAGQNFRDHEFSPDGAHLMTGSHDRTVRVWDTATGKLKSSLTGHLGRVVFAAFSSDGKRIVSAGDGDRTARVWEARTGESLAILSGHDSPVGQAIFNAQGDRVLSVESYPGNALRLWDAATGNLIEVMRGHTNGAEKVVFSPNGDRIASGGLDRTIRLWDGRTGKALASREGHRGAISSIAFSPDGKYLVSASQDQTARLWNAVTGEPLGVLHGHTGVIQTARYTADGRSIVTASVADGAVRLWDARAAEWNGSLRGHTDFVYGVAFHPDGERTASAAWDGTVRIWEATTGRQISLLSYPFPPGTEHKVVSSVAFHPAGKLIAAFGRDGAVRFWDLPSGQEAFSFQLPPSNRYSSDPRIALDARGKLVAAPGGSDHAVHIWDIERRSEVAVLKGHQSWVLESCFSPVGSWLATASHDRTLRIWDLARQAQIQVLEGHDDSVNAVEVSRDGKWLASGSGDGTLRLWDTSTWKQVAVLKHGTIVYGVAFSPDGTRLASACANNMVRFWDMITFQLVAELDGHGAYVHQIAFSPDGTRLVSGSGDSSVRVWDSLTAQARAKRAAETPRP